MIKITAEVICDSIATHNRRLTTFLTRYPRFVHAEHCRHRAMSLCVSSSRDIPTARYLEIVRSDEERAEPAFWGAAQKGEELDDTDACIDWLLYFDGSIAKPVCEKITVREAVKREWKQAALNAVASAQRMAAYGAHKSNRLLDPFVPVNVLVTCCEPGLLNWFGLRLDRSADPTIRALAEAMWAAWSESRPGKLEPGQWHLPFVDDETKNEIDGDEMLMQSRDSHNPLFYRPGGLFNHVLIEISTARCARLSYTSYETNKRSTVEEDLALYDRLITARPIHASPAEHQATPDETKDWNIVINVPTGSDARAARETSGHASFRYANPHLHGNLSGFVQHRKMLPGEAVAALPEGYEYRRPI